MGIGCGCEACETHGVAMGDVMAKARMFFS